MKTIDILKLKPFERIFHSRYGKSRIVEIIGSSPEDFFGAVIKPLTSKGKRTLFYDSGTTIDTFLEDSPGNIKQYEIFHSSRRKTSFNLIDAEHGRNFLIEHFRDNHNKPRIPERQINAFAQIQKQTGGLFVEGGRIWFEGELENIFQDYQKKEGWTGYDFTYCKLRFKNRKYVTFVVIDKLETGCIIACHDGYFSFMAESQTFNHNEKRILTQVTEYIYKKSLTHPVITYDFVENFC